MFFRIERLDCRRFRCAHPPFSLCTSPTLPARADRLSCFFSVPGSDIYQPLQKPSSLLRSHQDRLILVDAHPRRPLIGRVPARHAHTGHAPSGSAAGASRHPLGLLRESDRRLASCSVSLPHCFSSSGWNGECISRPRLRRSWRSRHRSPLRHTGLTALPWPLRGQRLRRKCLRRVSVDLYAPRSPGARLPVTWAGPPPRPGGPVRSTPERTEWFP